jgi:N4-(beta-N-acetylglucosaminyl)-L-asparaginase
MHNIGRRSFLGGVALTGIAASIRAKAPVRGGPVVVSSANGIRATARASEILLGGGRPLDAAIAGVNIVEEDPEEISVGYGGLPNEAGVVELDASVMDGATGGAGAVAAIQGVKTPSKVARVVMERTPHVMLVGEGAQHFAKVHGFKIEELLTENARRIWLEWLESHSADDNWGPPVYKPEDGGRAAGTSDPLDPSTQLARWIARHPPTGTITCLALAADGNLAGTTTTAGLAFKLPGRVGDSPIIGCGLYVDNAVGAAGSTGLGEECIKITGARTVVENMRRGMTPKDACLDAINRVVERHRTQGRPSWDLQFYALNRDGEHAAASIWNGHPGPNGFQSSQYAVFDGSGNSLRDCAYVFKR